VKSYKKHKIALALRTVALVLASLAFFNTDVASAQNVPTVLVHTPPRLNDLPPPGYPLTLLVRLKNTKDTGRKVRALLVRDGQLADVALQEGRFVDSDEPQYSFSSSSPRAELVYQFVLYNSDGSFTLSERYRLRRNCAPSVDLTDASLDPSLQSDTRLQALIGKAQGLERDITRYERAVGLLEEMKQLTSK
jgi:hypothetical protein